MSRIRPVFGLLSRNAVLTLAGFASASTLLAQAPPPVSPLTPAPRSGAADATLTAQLENSPLRTADALKDLDEEAGSTSASATTNDSGPVGIVPLTPGFNASLGATGQHDSVEGYSSILTPNIAFRFSPHFSANLGLPIYTYINVYGVLQTIAATKTTAAQEIDGYKERHFLLGDTVLAAAFEAHPSFFDYNVVTSLGAPTGDHDKGLGAGQFTYNINNHFEKPLGDIFTPDLELGIGDTTNLVDRRIEKSYDDLGTNLHMQLGANLNLPYNISFSSDAYEDLPLTTQTITTTTTNGKKGKQSKTSTTTSSKSVGEDNGFINALDVPLSKHVVLSGFYNRSLRNKIDTAGLSLTFLFKAPPRGKTPVH